MADQTVHETVRLLARVGEQVFVPLFVQPSRNRFPQYADDPTEALKLFLSSYAFERQGRSPSYGELAVRALNGVNIISNELADATDLAANVWREFCELGKFGDPKNQGANPKNSPLWPGRDGSRPSDAISVALSHELDQDDHNLYRFARRGVACNELDKAHATLQHIRGIGPKIASLFLRDVALDQNRSDVRLRNRQLLQPVDIWLRRTAERLAQQTFANDKEAAKKIVCLADGAGCSALLLNAGSWYFGSQIARTLQTLDEALRTPDSAKSLIQQHHERVCKEVKLLGLFEKQHPQSRRTVRELAQ